MTNKSLVFTALVTLLSSTTFAEAGESYSAGGFGGGESYAAAGNIGIAESGTGRRALLDPPGPLERPRANESRLNLSSLGTAPPPVDSYRVPRAVDVMQPTISPFSPQTSAIAAAGDPPPQSAMGAMEQQKGPLYSTQQGNDLLGYDIK